MRQCEICGKGSVIRGKRVLLRGKYNPTSTARKYPNLQRIKLADGKQVLACAKCIKNLHRAAK